MVPEGGRQMWNIYLLTNDLQVREEKFGPGPFSAPPGPRFGPKMAKNPYFSKMGPICGRRAIGTQFSSKGVKKVPTKI